MHQSCLLSQVPQIQADHGRPQIRPQIFSKYISTWDQCSGRSCGSSLKRTGRHEMTIGSSKQAGRHSLSSALAPHMRSTVWFIVTGLWAWQSTEQCTHQVARIMCCNGAAVSLARLMFYKRLHTGMCFLPSMYRPLSP